MKYIPFLIALVMVLPATAAAAGDSVSIGSIDTSTFCKDGEIKASGTAYFVSGLGNGDRRIEISVDDSLVYHDYASPTDEEQSWTFSKQDVVGDHEVEAKIYAVSEGTLDTATRSFTIEPCTTVKASSSSSSSTHHTVSKPHYERVPVGREAWFYFPVPVEQRAILQQIWDLNPDLGGITVQQLLPYVWCLNRYGADSCKSPI